MRFLARHNDGADRRGGSLRRGTCNALVSPPAIPDLGLLVSNGLRAKLPEQAPWLRTQANESIWVERKAFSGVVHGGEKIDVSRIPGDLTQLRREVERAADWLVNEIVAKAR